MRYAAAGARLVGDAGDESQAGVEPEVITANGLTAKLEAEYGLTSSIRAEAPRAAEPAVEVLMTSGNYGILTNKAACLLCSVAVPPKEPGCSNAPTVSKSTSNRGRKVHAIDLPSLREGDEYGLNSCARGARPTLVFYPLASSS